MYSETTSTTTSHPLTNSREAKSLEELWLRIATATPPTAPTCGFYIASSFLVLILTAPIFTNVPLIAAHVA